MIQAGICLDRIANALVNMHTWPGRTHAAREAQRIHYFCPLADSQVLLSLLSGPCQTCQANQGVGSALSNREEMHMPYELQLLMQQNTAKTVRQDIPGCSNLLLSLLALYLQLGK